MKARLVVTSYKPSGKLYTSQYITIEAMPYWDDGFKRKLSEAISPLNDSFAYLVENDPKQRERTGPKEEIPYINRLYYPGELT